MVIGLTGYACLALMVPWGMRGMWSLNVLPVLHCGRGMQACSHKSVIETHLLLLLFNSQGSSQRISGQH